jgi:hypothetical protein
MTTEPVPPVADRCASHVDVTFDEIRALCLSLIRQLPELHYLAHYTNGGYDFSYDVLATLPDPHAEPHIYERAGIQIANAVHGFDIALRQVRTGALIRTVAHAKRGMMMCNSVVPEEHVVAFTHDQTAVAVPDSVLADLAGARKVDTAIAQLVTVLRKQVSLGQQNPGSYISTKPEDRLEGDDAGTGGFAVFSAATPDPDENLPLGEMLESRVSEDDLQFVAYCRGPRTEATADRLHHPQLGGYFHQISVAERRAFYEELCRELPGMVRQIGRMTSMIIGGRVDRLVLNVEQGAIYYYRTGLGEYVMGVTIVQDRVGVTDSKMSRIANICRARSRATAGR